MTPARTSHGRLAAGTIIMHVEWVRRLHMKRQPFALQGDYRTAKSNAMKHPHLINGEPMREQSWPLNPNRSASRTKKLGLWTGWEAGYETLGPWRQTLRIERWQRRSNKSKSKTTRTETTPPGSPPSHQHFIICPRCEAKVSKLFMVLCTLEEVIDAEFAEAWIAHVDAQHQATRLAPPTQRLKLRARIIDRYGLLFRARRLVCRSCLNVRYGQVREESRREDTYFREKIEREASKGRPYHTNRPR